MDCVTFEREGSGYIVYGIVEPNENSTEIKHKIGRLRHSMGGVWLFVAVESEENAWHLDCANLKEIINKMKELNEEDETWSD